MEYTNTSVPGVAVGIGTMQNTEAEFLKLLREKKKTRIFASVLQRLGKITLIIWYSTYSSVHDFSAEVW